MKSCVGKVGHHTRGMIENFLKPDRDRQDQIGNDDTCSGDKQRERVVIVRGHFNTSDKSGITRRALAVRAAT